MRDVNAPLRLHFPLERSTVPKTVITDIYITLSAYILFGSLELAKVAFQLVAYINPFLLARRQTSFVHELDGSKRMIIGRVLRSKSARSEYTYQFRGSHESAVKPSAGDQRGATQRTK